jgi:hypothetical protein
MQEKSQLETFDGNDCEMTDMIDVVLDDPVLLSTLTLKNFASVWLEKSFTERESILENHVNALKPLILNKPYDKTIFCSHTDAEIISKLDFLQEIPTPSFAVSLKQFLISKVVIDDDIEAFKIHYALRLTVSSSIPQLIPHFVAKGCLKILGFLSSQKYNLCMYSVRIAVLSSSLSYMDAIFNMFEIEDRFIIGAIHTAALYDCLDAFNYLFERYPEFITKTFPKKANLLLILEPTIKHKITYRLITAPHLPGIYPMMPTTKPDISDHLYQIKFIFVP